MSGNPNPQDDALDGAPKESDRALIPSDQRGLFTQIVDWYKSARDHWHDWRQQAMEDYQFVAGYQWSDDDLKVLNEQLRPVITFNRVGPFLDGVSGLEIQNRQETRYIPRTVGQSGVNELLTAAAKWVRDDCDAEDEESDSFLDVVTCGIGVTQTNMSYDQYQDGMPVLARLDPLSVMYDPSSRKKNFGDARYVFYFRDIDKEAAEELFPDAEDWELDAGWARDLENEAQDPHNARAAPFYRIDQSGNIDKSKMRVRMVEVEWWEWERGYKVWDQMSGKPPQKMNRTQHDTMQKRARQLNSINPSFPSSYPSVPFRHRRYYRAVVGGKILAQTDGPEEGGFTIKGITGKRDHKNGTYYGLVRAMKDPQRWANKFFAQTLHIINTNAKGGIMAESDAFENPNEAEDTWADPSSITVVAVGALTGSQGPKIVPKPQVQFPAGIQQMMEYAISAIPSVTGISPEMMGQVDRNQPGILEMQRKQQGMTLLAGFFDSLRRYRKEQGRLLLWMITEFISDGRLIRIGGPDDAQYVPLVRDPQLSEYDVVVDDTPSSPNMKERVWNALMQLFPMMKDMGVPPDVWMDAMEFSPLPATFIGKAKASIEKQQQAAQQGGQDPRMQSEIQERQAKAQYMQAHAKHEDAKAQQVGHLGAVDASYKQAQIENLKAGAAANLAKVGIAQDDQRFEMLMSAVEALLNVHHAQHNQRMDIMGAAQQAQQDQQAQQQQAMQPQGTPGGGGPPPGVDGIPAKEAMPRPPPPQQQPGSMTGAPAFQGA